MNNDRQLKTLYTSAYKFLQDHIGKSELDKRLDHYRSDHRASTIEEVFYQMVGSLKNKRGMARTVGYIDPLPPSCLTLIHTKFTIIIKMIAEQNEKSIDNFPFLGTTFSPGLNLLRARLPPPLGFGRHPNGQARLHFI